MITLTRTQWGSCLKLRPIYFMHMLMRTIWALISAGGRHHAKVRLCCLSKAINLDLGESVLIIRSVGCCQVALSLTAVNGGEGGRGGGRPAFLPPPTKRAPLKAVVLRLGCVWDSGTLTLAPCLVSTHPGILVNWSWVQTGLGQCFLHHVS